MGILDKAKNAAKTTKLKGEIALLDRDMHGKKQKFGVELSDLLWDIEAKQKAVGGRESMFLTSLRIQWDVAKEDLMKTRAMNSFRSYGGVLSHFLSNLVEDSRRSRGRGKWPLLRKRSIRRNTGVSKALNRT